MTESFRYLRVRKLKALAYHGEDDLHVEDVEEPRCQDGCAIIQVKKAGVYGTEIRDPVPYDLGLLTYGEIQLMGTCIYTFWNFSDAISLLEERTIQFLPLITYRFPLEQGAEVFETLDQR